MTISLEEFARRGGKARARKLGPERCARIARKAAKARWAKAELAAKLAKARG